jgi:peroxiredoxin
MKKLVAGIFVLVSFAAHAQYKVGDKVADFTLKNVDDKTVSLSSHLATKGAIIVFTCNHCPFSKAYEDRIIALHNKYAPLGYPVIAINPNDKVKSPEDSYEKMQERAKEKGFPFPYLYDESQDVAKAFGAARTPHVFIVNAADNNEWILKYIGAIDNNTEDAAKADKKYTEDALQALLAGKNPTPSETKAIGCTIKWK